ncbi:sodium-dependent transporter [Thiomicrospira pelophila]|uniref:sodium-dependent transporter n=1 Tax=Thiomicrospira pelophila TaxID=934 RepID=UPI000AF86D0A
MSLLKLSTQSWSSQTVFIMAAVGSAVGLGNIWKFPYIAGDNGGGAFVLVYLACILIIGLPILLSEIALGRTGQANPVQAMANVAHESDASRVWSGLGFNGVLAGLLILSFYTVIAGIAVAYFVTSVQGVFVDITSQQAQDLFEAKVASPWELLFWHSLVTLFTIVIVSKGIRSGLEKAINFMMPGLLIILLVLLAYATTTGFFGQSVAFMFTPDFSKLSWEAVLIALGHAFFTLSIGLGTMMAYGAYVNQNMSIVKASVWIVVMDTLIALMAGLVIFSVVFANDLAPGAGPGLLFQTLPIAFGQMVGGWFFGSLFFLLVVMAALSSAISLIEPAVSWFEQNWGIFAPKIGLDLGCNCLVDRPGYGTIL